MRERHPLYLLVILGYCVAIAGAAATCHFFAAAGFVVLGFAWAIFAGGQR